MTCLIANLWICCETISTSCIYLYLKEFSKLNQNLSCTSKSFYKATIYCGRSPKIYFFLADKSEQTNHLLHFLSNKNIYFEICIYKDYWQLYLQKRRRKQNLIIRYSSNIITKCILLAIFIWYSAYPFFLFRINTG